MRLIYILVLLFSGPIFTHAAADCGMMKIRGLTIQAERENNSKYANTMRVLVDHGTCEGVKYAYLKNSNPAYHGILSAILAAQSTNSSLQIWVKDAPGIYTDAREIEWINH